jgi:hypothetical protein
LTQIALIGDRDKGFDEIRANVLQDRSEHPHVVWGVNPSTVTAYLNKAGITDNEINIGATGWLGVLWRTMSIVVDHVESVEQAVWDGQLLK